MTISTIYWILLCDRPCACTLWSLSPFSPDKDLKRWVEVLSHLQTETLKLRQIKMLSRRWQQVVPLSGRRKVVAPWETSPLQRGLGSARLWGISRR